MGFAVAAFVNFYNCGLVTEVILDLQQPRSYNIPIKAMELCWMLKMGFSFLALGPQYAQTWWGHFGNFQG